MQESDSGRNQKFHDNKTGADMTRAQFVRQTETGNYDEYHVRRIHGTKTPVSNPDGVGSNGPSTFDKALRQHQDIFNVIATGELRTEGNHFPNTQQRHLLSP